MVRDSTAVGLGVPYIILIALTWVNAGILNLYFMIGLPWIYTHPGCLWIIVGCLFLIPVFILTLVFMSNSDEDTEKVAFGLALPGWFLILIGTMIGLYYTTSNYVTPALFFVYILPQIVLGFGLYARRNYLSSDSAPQRPPQPRYTARPVAPTPRRSNPGPTPRGRINIPEEVRLAGTYGQSIKNCVRCGSTLDARTVVCYFCGARQPPAQRQPPASRPAPTPAPHEALPPRTPEEFNFCPNCGARIRQGHLFCTQCGSSLE